MGFQRLLEGSGAAQDRLLDRTLSY